jgi:hypothetical protein
MLDAARADAAAANLLVPCPGTDEFELQAGPAGKTGLDALDRWRRDR